MNRVAARCVRAMDERRLIERHFLRPMTDAGVDAGVVVGIGDDAAVLACDACAKASGGRHLAVTADTLVEGRHFAAGTGAADVGHKALAVSLSDLAAMGASPRWAMLCLSLPWADEAEMDRWVAEFARGFFALAKRWKIALVGGDLVRGPCTVTVQLGGAVDPSQTLLRSGARPGDGIYLTGAVGDAGLAWRCPDKLPALAAAVVAGCTRRLHRPEPRVEEGRLIARFASAAIDVSDGLLCDLSRLARASGVAAQVEIERVPLGEGCRAVCREPGDWSLPLTGGDDYELLFTMDDEHLPALEQALAAEPGCAAVTRIGRVAEEDGQPLVCTFQGDDWPLPAVQGFDHFEP